jgi:hypothetical protein
MRNNEFTGKPNGHFTADDPAWSANDAVGGVRENHTAFDLNDVVPAEGAD